MFRDRCDSLFLNPFPPFAIGHSQVENHQRSSVSDSSFFNRYILSRPPGNGIRIS